MPARYSTDQLLDAALELFAHHGLQGVTVAAVARHARAPSGSVYHRFSGREALIACLWLRTIERFQQGYIEALTDEDAVRAAQRATRHVLDWVRANPQEGLLLLRHGAEDLVSDELDEDLVRRVAQQRQRLESAVRHWRRRHPGRPSSRRARFALMDLPYAAVRPYLEVGEPLSREIDQMVDDAVVAVLR